MWVDLESPDPAVIDKATRVICSGGVVLYPSDTIYGLGCDPFNRAAVKRIYALKLRDAGKGVLLLVPNRLWADRLAVEIPPVANHLMERYWPGPLTLLFRPRSSVPSILVGGGERIGVRCPDNPFLQAWLDSWCKPIVSTSANRSGIPAPETMEDLRDLFYDRVDLFLEAGEPTARAPSTVVDIVGVPRIVRSGARDKEIENALAHFEEGQSSASRRSVEER